MSAAISATGTFPGNLVVVPPTAEPPASTRPAAGPPVINPALNISARHPVRIRPWAVVLLAIFLLVGLGVWNVTGIFRLGSETAALRNSFMSSSGAEWKTRIAVNLGRITFGLVQLGTGFIHMPPEGHAAINGLKQAEVGVYEMAYQPNPLEVGSVLASTDKAMAKRGCVRIVGVVQKDNLVVVYAPKNANLASRIQASVLVLHENRLVVVGARANPSELMKLVPADALASLHAGVDGHHAPFRF